MDNDDYPEWAADDPKDAFNDDTFGGDPTFGGGGAFGHGEEVGMDDETFGTGEDLTTDWMKNDEMQQRILEEQEMFRRMQKKDENSDDADGIDEAFHIDLDDEDEDVHSRHRSARPAVVTHGSPVPGRAAFGASPLNVSGSIWSAAPTDNIATQKLLTPGEIDHKAFNAVVGSPGARAGAFPERASPPDRSPQVYSLEEVEARMRAGGIPRSTGPMAHPRSPVPPHHHAAPDPRMYTAAGYPHQMPGAHGGHPSYPPAPYPPRPYPPGYDPAYDPRVAQAQRPPQGPPSYPLPPGAANMTPQQIHSAQQMYAAAAFRQYQMTQQRLAAQHGGDAHARGDGRPAYDAAAFPPLAVGAHSAAPPEEFRDQRHAPSYGQGAHERGPRQHDPSNDLYNGLQHRRFSPQQQQQPQQQQFSGQYAAPQQRRHRDEPDVGEGGMMMSRYEIGVVVKIQMAQVETLNPYVDDYYYQVMKERAAQREGRTAPAQLFSDYKDRSASYAPPVLSGVLGKIRFRTVRAPKTLLQLETEEGDPTDPGAVSADLHGEMSGYRMRVENAFFVLLATHDIEKRLTAVSSAERARLQTQREGHVHALFNTLGVCALEEGLSAEPLPYAPRRWHIEQDEVFVRMAVLGKGKKLLRRALPLFSSVQMHAILMAIARNLLTLTETNTDEHQAEALAVMREMVEVVTSCPSIIANAAMQSMLSFHPRPELIRIVSTASGRLFLGTLLRKGQRVKRDPSQSETWGHLFAQLAERLDGAWGPLLAASPPADTAQNLADETTFANIVVAYARCTGPTQRTALASELRGARESAELAALADAVITVEA